MALFNKRDTSEAKSGFADKKPRRTLAEVFMKDKHTKTMGVVILMAAFLIGYAELDYIIPEYVTITYSDMKGSEETKVQTRTRTVGELLAEQGITPSDIDIVMPGTDALVTNRLKVEVKECVETKAEIVGHKQDFILMPGTVATNLKHNGVKYDDDDIIKPALDKKVSAKTKIVVKERHTKVKEKQEVIEPEDKIILDPSVQSGVITETEGEAGEAVFKYTTTYINGKKKGTKKTVKKWIKKPTDHVLTLGTSATGESGETSFIREFTAETTAYTAGPGARGSTGQVVHFGTCAVDPSVIPYGSLLYVEGYGTAIANDCGGAVRGNIVDLYLGSTSACIQWGRRNCRAFILNR